MLLLVIDEDETVVKFKTSWIAPEQFGEFRKIRDEANCIEEQGYIYCPRSSWKEFRGQMRALGFQVQGRMDPTGFRCSGGGVPESYSAAQRRDDFERAREERARMLQEIADSPSGSPTVDRLREQGKHRQADNVLRLLREKKGGLPK